MRPYASMKDKYSPCRPVNLGLGISDSIDERLDALHCFVPVKHGKIELTRKCRERLGPMRRQLEHRRPTVCIASAKHCFARLSKSRVVGDERRHQQDVNQIFESLVPFAGPRRQCHPVKLLRYVQAQRETGQFRRTGDADRILKRNRRYQLYFTLSRLGASNIDDDARPRAPW